MYAPPYANETRADVLREFVERHSFATLVHHARSGYSATHLPILLDDTNDEASAAPIEGAQLTAHVARANDIWRRIERDPDVLLVFIGPNHYISPNWKSSGPSVPTWNYAAVHLHCKAGAFFDRHRLLHQMDRLAERFEPAVGEDWKRAETDASMVDGLLPGVVGIEFVVQSCEATFKLGQNLSPADVASVSNRLVEFSSDNAVDVAELMRVHTSKT